MMKDKNDANYMSFENTDIIYEQFTWLEAIRSRATVKEAKVSRVDESTLNLCTGQVSSHTMFDGILVPHRKIPLVSLYFVDQSGESMQLGQSMVMERLCFRWVKFQQFFTESVRDKLKETLLYDRFKPYWMVEVKHVYNYYGNKEFNATVTVYKPPQKNITLDKWYADKIAEIRNRIRNFAESD